VISSSVLFYLILSEAGNINIDLLKQ